LGIHLPIRLYPINLVVASSDKKRGRYKNTRRCTSLNAHEKFLNCLDAVFKNFETIKYLSSIIHHQAWAILLVKTKQLQLFALNPFKLKHSDHL